MKQQNSGIQLICAVLLAILPFGSWTQDKEIVDKNFSFSEYLENRQVAPSDVYAS